MKNISTYKAVLYEGESVDADFWDGKAVDYQIRGDATREISEYWIKDFLKSEYKTTPKTGTKRLAKALKGAITKTTDLEVKQEMVASAVLARNLDTESISVAEFCQKYSISENGIKSIYSELNNPKLADEIFQFDNEEFDKHTSYKIIELDNDVIMSSPTGTFDSNIKSEPVQNIDGLYRFITEGRVKNTKIKSTA